MPNDVLTETIFYAGDEYCIIPYEIDNVFLCITGNSVIGVSFEEEIYTYSQKRNSVINIQAREIFTTKTMNKKITNLANTDEKFFKQVFSHGNAMNEIINNNLKFQNKRKKLIEIIEKGLIGNKIERNQLEAQVSSLIEEKCVIQNSRIISNRNAMTLFEYCIGVFKTFTEEKKMGLFDSFFGDNDGNRKVLGYIKSMSSDKILSIIENEYFKIKGNCQYVPQMGEYGSFEFAGALLLWEYAKNNLHSNMNSMGALMIALGATIGYAFNGMSAGEWSDKIDEVINASDDVLSYPEWSDIYNYLKMNFSSEIHRLEFNNGTYSEQTRQKIYGSFVILYNNLPDFNSVLNYYEEQGLHIKSQIPFNIGN